MTRARLAIGASVAAIVLFVAFGAALLNAPGLLPAPDLPRQRCSDLFVSQSDQLVHHEDPAMVSRQFPNRTGR